MKSFVNRNTLFIGAVWLVVLLVCFVLGVRKAAAVPTPPPACESCDCKDIMAWNFNFSNFAAFTADANKTPIIVAFVNLNVKEDCSNTTNLTDNNKKYNKWQLQAGIGELACTPAQGSPLVTEVIADPGNLPTTGNAWIPSVEWKNCAP